MQTYLLLLNLMFTSVNGSADENEDPVTENTEDNQTPPTVEIPLGNVPIEVISVNEVVLEVDSTVGACVTQVNSEAPAVFEKVQKKQGCFSRIFCGCCKKDSQDVDHVEVPSSENLEKEAQTGSEQPVADEGRETAV